MRDSARELPNRLHLLRLEELRLQVVALGHILRDDEDRQDVQRPRLQAAEEIAEPPREARAECQRDREQLVPDGPGRRDGVELVGVIEDGRLGRARGIPVVMAGNRVQQLDACRRIERVGALLDEPQAEMNVAE